MRYEATTISPITARMITVHLKSFFPLLSEILFSISFTMSLSKTFLVLSIVSLIGFDFVNGGGLLIYLFFCPSEILLCQVTTELSTK